MNLAEARFEVDGRDVTSIVIFGNETAPALLGAVALESLGLGVDPGSKRLVPIVAPMFFISLSFSLCTSPKPAIPTREIRVFALSALGNPFESAMV